MDKDLKYYMGLPYTIVVKQGDDNDGSVCYVASFIELSYCIGVGKTPAEAIKELKLHQRMKFEAHLEEDLPIPEPQPKFSGNINIRVDPELHARLSQEAAVYDMSLNKYASLILERRRIGVLEEKPLVVREKPGKAYNAGKPRKRVKK